MANIAVITDMDKTGSGYRNLCTPLLTGLADMGHNIKVAGLYYQGEEHDYPFSIIPASNIQDAFAIAHNLCFTWQPDLFLVAMDIPLQRYFHSQLRPLNRKYIAITPLENPPLTMSWAATLMSMDGVFFISELGKQAAIKAGISKAEHLQVGVDTDFWHPATPEEKQTLRKGLGIDDDEFVVLTVADNQERKNLWAGMEAIRLLKEKYTNRKVRYVLVTRKDSQVGWALDDLAVEMGLMKNLTIFNRGMPASDLWALYAVADVYLQPSKAEGLGMPVLEAMACGVLCVATDTGALHELLDDGRGILVAPEYTFRDVWGNSKRDMMSTEWAADYLSKKANGEFTFPTDRTLEFVRAKTWDIPTKQVDDMIKDVLNEKAK